MTPEDNEHEADRQSTPDDGDQAAGSAGEGAPAPGGEEKPAREPRPLDLEPAEASAMDDASARAEASKPAARAEPEPEPSGVQALDVCPNCGSPMRGRDTLVCMRCGFDLKAMKVIETETGQTTEEEEEERREPLVEEGAGDPWLPAALAIAAAVVLLIGYLAGAAGLFPQVRSALEEGALFSASWDARWGGAARFPLLIALWTMCGFGSLVAAAWLFGRPFGNVGLGALRMLAIIAIARCVGFLSFPWRLVEFTAEAIAAAAAFFILSMLLFRLKPRDAATVLVVTIVLFLALYVIARIVTWVT
jgi:hypothetical protein